jgi:hypothetical protein
MAKLTKVESDDAFPYWAVKQFAQWHQDTSGQKITMDVSRAENNWGAFVLHSDKDEARIVVDSRLSHDLSLVVMSLLVDQTALQSIQRREKRVSPNARQQFTDHKNAANVKTVRELVLQNLELGLSAFLSKNRELECVFCNACQDLLRLDEDLECIAKVAVGTAISFVLQHELSHVLGSHRAYKKYAYEMEFALHHDSEKTLRAVEPDLQLLELCADSNAHGALFQLVTALRSEFKDLNHHDSIYLAAVAGGIGIGAYFLFLNTMAEGDGVHPSANIRIAWACKSVFWECPKEDESDGSELTGAYYRRLYCHGIYEGMREALRLWDLRGLQRRRLAYLDQFMSEGMPCLICNEAAAPLMAELLKIADDMMALNERMERSGALERSLNSLATHYTQPSEIAAELFEEANKIVQRRESLKKKLALQDGGEPLSTSG